MADRILKRINGIGIDPIIFNFKFTCKCTGECCYYGVYTDSDEQQKIFTLKEKLFPLLDESQPKDEAEWFEEPEKDKDFKSGIAVGTQIYNHKCVFLDKSGLCSLQKLANLEGEHKWKYKPLYCILFPLTIYEGSLTIDDEHIERLRSCNKYKPENGLTTIFEACREELKYFFGEEGFKELQAYREEYLKNYGFENDLNPAVIDIQQNQSGE
ncbi:MAG TPA: DUF3109 family protein [Ignavibacteriaceae bacterium]|nr:DUF3109 family protein [Ignavibacteriaceae bacterium]